MWDLIHDRTHSHGDLPFDPFMIKQRMPFWLYALEELRCDLTAFREAVALEERGRRRTPCSSQYAIVLRPALPLPDHRRPGPQLRRARRPAAVRLAAPARRRCAGPTTRSAVDWERLPQAVDRPARARSRSSTATASTAPSWRTGWPPYELVSGYVDAAPGSVWAQGADALPLDGAAEGADRRGAAGRVPAEHVLRGAAQKLADVIDATAGITRMSPAGPVRRRGRRRGWSSWPGRPVPRGRRWARLAAAGATVVAADASAERLGRGVARAALRRRRRHVTATSSTCSTSGHRTGPREVLARARPGRRPGAPRRRLARRRRPSPRPTWPTGTLLQDLLIRTAAAHLARLPRRLQRQRRRAAGRWSSTVQAPGAARPGNAAYAAAKAAAEAWTLAVADSLQAARRRRRASILPIKALVTDQMRAAEPEREVPRLHRRPRPRRRHRRPVATAGRRAERHATRHLTATDPGDTPLHDPEAPRLRQRQLRRRAPRGARGDRRSPTAGTRSPTATTSTPRALPGRLPAALRPRRRGLPGLQRHRRQRRRAAGDDRPLGGGDLRRVRAHQRRRGRRARAGAAGSSCSTVPTPDGKLTPELIDRQAWGFGDEHRAQPQVVSITQTHRARHAATPPTEIAAIAEHAHELGHAACTSTAPGSPTPPRRSDVPLRAFTTDAGVDVLSFGGTKNGLMFGEAIVVLNPDAVPRRGLPAQDRRCSWPRRCASSRRSSRRCSPATCGCATPGTPTRWPGASPPRVRDIPGVRDPAPGAGQRGLRRPARRRHRAAAEAVPRSTSGTRPPARCAGCRLRHHRGRTSTPSPRPLAAEMGAA